jgi:DNA topoisomerase-1
MATTRKKSAAKKKAVKRVAKRKSAPKAKAVVKRASKPRGRSNGAFQDESHESGSALVVVESPAKAKTIGKYLGRGYRVRATLGHLRDLPQKKLGIDVDNGFKPEYETIVGKEKTLADLRAAAKDASEILLATDPDREGEAIAWHVAEQIKRRGGAPVRRVLFHEITKDAVRQAIANASTIDSRKVDAQQARRVLDRLVGYKASPVLWKTVKKGLSAGRVQTVALRLIVEREHEIRAFKAVEYWSIEALLAHGEQEFTAKLRQFDGAKPEINNASTAESIVADLKKHATFPVSDVKKRERRKNPSAPFITSTLQQEAAKKLGFGSKRTMRVAQDLYEGIELGKEEGAQGLITYMRTDSTRVSELSATQAREFVARTFGEDYLAAGGAQLYGSAKGKRTQDAHEAIRPTEPSRRPEELAKFLSKDQLALYQLVSAATSILKRYTIPVVGKFLKSSAKEKLRD